MSPYFEPQGPGPHDPVALVTAAIEAGAPAVLADEGALPAAFFDLRSGLAGEVGQRLALYDVAMAAVVADPTAHSGPFQAFVREANRGGLFRFFPVRADAVAWLEGREA